MRKSKWLSHMYKQPLSCKICHRVLSYIGPLIYIIIAVGPWVSRHDFQLPQWSLPELPSLVKIPKLFFKEKTYQVGSLKLRVNPHMVKVGNIDGFQSTVIEYDDFSLSWIRERPLVLIIADGSRQELLPIGYEKIKNGFSLQFSKELELHFYNEVDTNDVSADVQNQLGQLYVEMVSIGKFLSKISQVDLPWNLKSLNRAAKVGKYQIQIAENNYFSAIDEPKISETNYIHIPLAYYEFLDRFPIRSQEISQNDESNNIVAENSIIDDKQKEMQSVILLWQGKQEISSVESKDQKERKYQRLYQLYMERQFELMELAVQTQKIPGPDWIALYLELLRTQKDGKEYEQIRQQMQEIVREKGWSSINLAPYLGIAQQNLSSIINMDYNRIKQVRNDYSRDSWSFNGEADLAELLFHYGDLQLLLKMIKRAVTIAQEKELSEKEHFYLWAFLWRATSIYRRNGIILKQQAKREFYASLERISVSWQQGLSEGLALSYVLDVLDFLRSEELDLEKFSYPIITELFSLMDNNGNLPEKIGQNTGERIPFYRFWPVIGKLLQTPRSTTIVPGFWMWTAGTGDGYYKLGEPIELNVENFHQSNKLVLLYGIYFYPEEITVDGLSVGNNSSIPLPQLGQQASWFYEPENRLLAIEMPANQQDMSKIIIR